jgi:hypothetical protein
MMSGYKKVTIQTEGIAVSIPVEQLADPNRDYIRPEWWVGENGDDILDVRAFILSPEFEWVIGEYAGRKVLVPYKP